MNSMTGFGKAEGRIGNVHFSVEVKSVNHRFLDARFRLPNSFNQLELSLTDTLRTYCERGSVEVNIKPKATGAQAILPGTTRFMVDELAIKSLMDGVTWLHQKYQTNPIPSLEMLVSTNRIFLPVEEAPDSSTLLPQIQALLEVALKELQKMRQTEGIRLKQILHEGGQALLRLCDELTKLAPEQPQKIREKLTQRIEHYKLGAQADPQRLEWEVAYYADRAEISEEIDRLRTHCQEFLTLLASPKPVGRKLDFLTQELHREANTLGSKASQIELTRIAVEAKTQIEKLREQVQNVE